jgi:hypothetical protein
MAVKLKAKLKLWTAEMFYSLPKNYFNKSCMFVEYPLPYIIPGPYIK